MIFSYPSRADFDPQFAVARELRLTRKALKRQRRQEARERRKIETRELQSIMRASNDPDLEWLNEEFDRRAEKIIGDLEAMLTWDVTDDRKERARAAIDALKKKDVEAKAVKASAAKAAQKVSAAKREIVVETDRARAEREHRRDFEQAVRDGNMGLAALKFRHAMAARGFLHHSQLPQGYVDSCFRAEVDRIKETDRKASTQTAKTSSPANRETNSGGTKTMPKATKKDAGVEYAKTVAKLRAVSTDLNATPEDRRIATDALVQAGELDPRLARMTEQHAKCRNEGTRLVTEVMTSEQAKAELARRAAGGAR